MCIFKVLIVSLALSPVLQAQGDACIAALNPELKTRVYLKKDASNSDDVKAAFCSAQFETDAKSLDIGAAVTVPIYGVPVEFSGDYKSTDNWAKRKAFCGDSNRHFSTADSETFLTEFLPPKAFDAFVSCETSQHDSGPVKLTVNAIGKSVEIKADYNKVGASPDYARVVSFQQIGLVCSKDVFKKGEKIISGGVAHTCPRSGVGPVFVGLNTQMGSRTYMFPGERSNQPAGTYRVKITKQVPKEVWKRQVRIYVGVPGYKDEERRNSGDIGQQPGGLNSSQEYFHDATQGLCKETDSPDPGCGNVSEFTTELLDGGRDLHWTLKNNGPRCSEAIDAQIWEHITQPETYYISDNPEKLNYGKRL